MDANRQDYDRGWSLGGWGGVWEDQEQREVVAVGDGVVEG
jgi:hypothetical protein